MREACLLTCNYVLLGCLLAVLHCRDRALAVRVCCMLGLLVLAYMYGRLSEREFECLDQLAEEAGAYDNLTVHVCVCVSSHLCIVYVCNLRSNLGFC